MSNWQNDSWKDSYDAWKLMSPDDERPEECCHEDYEADINGRATCCRCGECWYLTSEEIERERRLSTAYDAMVRREERREWINRWISRLAFWRRWRKHEGVTDDLPF